MLRTLTKGWYLRCYKYWRRKLNVYPNIYSGESNFLCRGNSPVQFSQQRNKARQVFWWSYPKIWLFQIAYGLGTKLKIFTCELSHWHNPAPHSPPVRMHTHFDRLPPPLPLSANIIEYTLSIIETTQGKRLLFSVRGEAASSS